VQASAANIPFSGFQLVEHASDEVAGTFPNLERQLCRVFLFRISLALLKSSPAGAQPSWLWGRRASAFWIYWSAVFSYERKAVSKAFSYKNYFNG